MTVDQMRDVIAQCYYPSYSLAVNIDGRGAIFLQASYLEPDVDTGTIERQHTRRWFLSPEMTRGEIVQTAFKCILTSAEHRVREWFRYRDRAIFGPHYDIETLWEVCQRRDIRSDAR